MTFLSKKNEGEKKMEQTRKQPQQRNKSQTATKSADDEEEEGEGVVSVVWGRWTGNNRDKHGCQFHRLFINT